MKYLTLVTILAHVVLVGDLEPSFAATDASLDVNDVSFLWPVPTSKEDVDKLLTVAEKLEGSETSIWPRESFDAVIAKAQDIKVKNSAGRENGISFGPELKEPFSNPSTWKIVGVRVDPSAPGTEPKITEAFGSVPQVRLIAQPVTFNGAGKVTVHDVTAHLVFNYVERFGPATVEGGPPIAIPDKEAFGKIVADLVALKRYLKENGVETGGVLGVHPGLKEDVDGFADRLQTFLKKHLSAERFAATAFMGLDRPEPWIFFAMSHKDGAMTMMPHATLGGESAQMLNFRGGSHVMPVPKPSNLDGGKGVSTATLFVQGIENKLNDAALNGQQKPQLRDIPSIIANPQRASFFNTDCISCHSESSRRVELNIDDDDNEFRFARPEGISGMDETLLPQNKWNVRNFGWFQRNGLFPTVTRRTANEAAESADFINKTYLRADD